MRYNEEHNITPESIKKGINDILASVYEADYITVPVVQGREVIASEEELPVMIRKLKEEMKEAAKNLEFEKAAGLRDKIKELSSILLEMGEEI
jgi:excinuclease ABC subunit B